MGRSISDVDIVFPPGAAGITSRFAERTGATRIALREDEPDKMTERRRRAGEKTWFSISPRSGDPAWKTTSPSAISRLRPWRCPRCFHEVIPRRIDSFGGREAIRDKQIRVLSDKSFRQDPLRILRAFRLAAELDCHRGGNHCESSPGPGASRPRIGRARSR